MLYTDEFTPKSLLLHLDTVARFVELELVTPEIPMHEQWEAIKAGFDMLELITLQSNVKALLAALFKHEKYFNARFGSEAFNWVVTDLVRAQHLIEETLEVTNHFSMGLP
jgi:hypothetical protein